jgi:regulator of replication initiation timing
VVVDLSQSDAMTVVIVFRVKDMGITLVTFASSVPSAASIVVSTILSIWMSLTTIGRSAPIPVECTNKCGKHTKRKDLVQHLFKECPLTSILCEFCSAQIQRGEMHRHLAENLTTHISLMVDPFHEKISLLSQQIDDAEEKIRELSDDNQYLAGEVERLCLRASKNEEEIHRLRQDNLETQSLYSEMYQRNNELMRNFEGLQKEHEDLKQENEVLHERADQPSAELNYFQKKKPGIYDFESL